MYKAFVDISILHHLYHNRESAIKYRHTFLTKEFLLAHFKRRKWQASPWSFSGSKIYYNAGNVGIGTSTPAYPLEVIGDARISNNLYVGGGIIITDKVNAATEVVTSSIKTDSIATDSTMGFYGTTKFNGDVKLQNKLAVNGDALINGKTTVNGDFKTLGSLTFAGSKKISYTPPVGGGPGVFDFGGPGPIIPDPCYYVIPGTTVNQFTGLLQSYQSNASGTRSFIHGI